jgi:hypothetical protein
MKWKKLKALFTGRNSSPASGNAMVLYGTDGLMVKDESGEEYQVAKYIESEIEYRVRVALGDINALAHELVESQIDSMRQRTTMEVSALSGRIDRLEGVRTFPDRVIKHVGRPDEAAIRGEIEERLRSSRSGVATGFESGPMDRSVMPLPSALHQEARLATAADIGMADAGDS